MLDNLSYLALVDALREFKGISRRLAESLATQLGKTSETQIEDLIDKIRTLRKNQKRCLKCNLYQELELCSFCKNEQREKQLMIFESSNNVFKFAQISNYAGYYFVIDPLLNKKTKSDPIWMEQLFNFSEIVDEIILAISPTLNGEITINYLRQKLTRKGLKISRFATGLPVNSEISYLDPLTLLMAYENKK